MSNAVLGPSGVAGRYHTHRSQLMTLIVTRQGQEFVTSGDLQLCDVELVNASVELVGEPGLGNNGVIGSTHKSTMNTLHAVNEQGTTSTVYGLVAENRIQNKTHLNHGHLNISIIGMTQGHQFRKDVSVPGNNIDFLIPTDNGLAQYQEKNWPPVPLKLENVHLQQNLRVESVFAGTWPNALKVARFTEDWADTSGGTKRNADGTVRYIVGNDETQASVAECQVPANCIDMIKLVFKVSPRTEL